MNDMWNTAWLILAGLLPFLGFLVVCYVVMRRISMPTAIERKAMARGRSRGVLPATEDSPDIHALTRPALLP